MAPMASRRATSASWIGDSKGVGLSFIVSDDLDRKYSLGTASLGLLARNVLAGAHSIKEWGGIVTVVTDSQVAEVKI